ncbi:unnamed protein product [Arctia plantaginis]|uniref:Uncharacterized protein n=1 Tax=Arctia plantaginis TaxID=874455 RepID=A0A8S0ZCH3_ARCPL|nr:unnamed protein product [Arctia plantaginis]
MGSCLERDGQEMCDGGRERSAAPPRRATLPPNKLCSLARITRRVPRASPSGPYRSSWIILEVARSPALARCTLMTSCPGRA